MKGLNHKNTLIIGIGNCGRQDDGLGWAVLDAINDSTDFSGELIYRYQLNIEDADLIKDADNVIFVDAAKDGNDAGFNFDVLEPGGEFEFSTHALKPEIVLALCHSLYNKFPKAYSFFIKGYEWELKTGLTEAADKNLKKGLTFFKELILS